ncbi:DUF2164 family protein [Lysinibacillus sp. SGAir0095]|uniref:DUF2164 family protein n=1 Tax=Lysinibacillus sp. SGAir0095 TaxID=2070463 RepID=UPI0010CCBA87|nr:DUF2164 family protein [Lysinibacillus sp. SGAir0095]QCR32720.1 DUF2164 domain-containing protein [Lysinibacillus sp. SGAir0095]
MLKNLSKEQYQFIIQELHTFFLNERKEELTELEIERILKFFNETISPIIFNTLINDVFNTIEKQCQNLEEELLKLQFSALSKSLN